VNHARTISETISGSVEAMKREKFKMLINHQMESGDMLVVLKLDRLGRDNIDVQNTINLLTQFKQRKLRGYLNLKQQKH
jgi:DNA invertase Pin-like site-specific DNA recombinase